MGTTVLGRFFGRLVPYVIWALTAKGAWDYRKEIKSFINEMRKVDEFRNRDTLGHVH